MEDLSISDWISKRVFVLPAVFQDYLSQRVGERGASDMIHLTQTFSQLGHCLFEPMQCNIEFSCNACSQCSISESETEPSAAMAKRPSESMSSSVGYDASAAAAAAAGFPPVPLPPRAGQVYPWESYVMYAEKVEDKEAMCSWLVQCTDVMAKTLPVEEQLKMQLSSTLIQFTFYIIELNLIHTIEYFCCVDLNSLPRRMTSAVEMSRLIQWPSDQESRGAQQSVV